MLSQADLVKLKRLCDRHEIISFDVFDTTLYRKCGTPRTIFFKIGINFGISRIIAERLARGNARRRGHREVTLDEIYRFLPLRSPKKELDQEFENVYVDERVIALIQYARNSKKKIYFTSDMYLSAIQIEKLLEKVGIRRPFEILVSSEFRLPKRHGLFEILLKRESIDPSRVLHLGDNFESDVIPARLLGISTFFVGG